MLGFLRKIGFKTRGDWVSEFTPIINTIVEPEEKVVAWAIANIVGNFAWLSLIGQVGSPVLVVLTKKRLMAFPIHPLTNNLLSGSFFYLNEITFSRFADGYLYSSIKLKDKSDKSVMNLRYQKFGRLSFAKEMEVVAQELSGLTLEQLRSKYNSPLKRLLINLLKVPFYSLVVLIIAFIFAVILEAIKRIS